MSPDQETFSATDLRPTRAERRARWRERLDLAAAALGVAAAGLWGGGLVALGIYGGVAPFARLPEPLSSEAQAFALAGFDAVGLGAATVVLGCEMVRTALALRRRRGWLPRLRRLGALALAGCAAYVALAVAPHSLSLRATGAVPGEEATGRELARVERRALLVRQLEVPLAALFILLSVGTLRGRARADEAEEAQAPAPLAPGPRRPGRLA